MTQQDVLGFFWVVFYFVLVCFFFGFCSFFFLLLLHRSNTFPEKNAESLCLVVVIISIKTMRFRCFLGAQSESST